MGAKKDRIWELDALRGIAILCVVVLHGLYDLQTFLGWQILGNPTIHWIMQYGGILFVVLSGLCATLGSRSFRRGAVVLACGLVVSLVTWAMARLGMADENVIIRFGVLHLLGVCMLLWPALGHLPTWALTMLGAGIVILGFWFEGMRVSCRWLFPLGLQYPGFSSADYFPVFPQLGWFLLGAAVGRTAYRGKTTRLPSFPCQAAPIRFLRWCGTHSLWIYLLHQPLLYGLLELLQVIQNGLP